MQTAEELGNYSVRPDVHAESGNHAFGSKGDGRQTSGGDWVVVRESVQNVVDVIVEHVEFSSLLNLMSIFDVSHNREILKTSTTLAVQLMWFHNAIDII